MKIDSIAYRSRINVGDIRRSNDRRWQLRNERHAARTTRSRPNWSVTREIKRVWHSRNFTGLTTLGTLGAFTGLTTIGIQLRNHSLNLTECIRSNGNRALRNQTHLLWSCRCGRFDNGSNHLRIRLGCLNGRLDNLASAAWSGGNLSRDDFKDFGLLGSYCVFHGNRESNAIDFCIRWDRTQRRTEQGVENGFFHF